MQIDLPYGRGETVSAEIPDARVAGFVSPNTVEIGDELQTLRQALSQPIDAPSFRDFLADARDVLFIVNDATRPTPTARVLDVIAADLEGVDCKFIVATGVHRAPTEDEYVQIFGEHYARLKDRVHAHDARADEMEFLAVDRERLRLSGEDDEMRGLTAGRFSRSSLSIFRPSFLPAGRCSLPRGAAETPARLPARRWEPGRDPWGRRHPSRPPRSRGARPRTVR